MALSWMIGSAPLAALNALDPDTAHRFFDVSTSFIIGFPQAGFAAKRVTKYESFAEFQTTPSSTRWVLYDPEKWDLTPLAEQQHPGGYMKRFANLAHESGNRVIMTPARDLVIVPGANCTKVATETMDQAYIRCRIPAKAANAYGDIVEVQAQGDQAYAAQYTWLVENAKAQVTTGVPVWAGLTTLRGDTAEELRACYDATHSIVQGYWLNTSKDTIAVAAEFLASVV